MQWGETLVRASTNIGDGATSNCVGEIIKKSQLLWHINNVKQQTQAQPSTINNSPYYKVTVSKIDPRKQFIKDIKG
eukprot:11280687-Ditylum_brightwellii.AAC.1